MAWNRPSNEKVEKKGGGGQRNVHLRGLLAGAIVVVLGAALAWYFLSASRTSQTPRTSRTSPSSSLIKEVKPVLASKPTPEKPKDPPGYWNGKKITNKNRPPWMSPYHRVVDYGPIHTNVPSEALKAVWEKVFDNAVDQEIASYLVIEPGTSFLGDGEGLYDGFDEAFVESLKEPVIVKATDDDYTKQLKRALIETKADLKARMDKGESVQKIMEDTRRAYKELGVFKEEIADQLETLCEKSSFTEADVDDCIAAANKMLEDRGCEPLSMPDFYRRRLVLKAQNSQNAENENDEE